MGIGIFKKMKNLFSKVGNTVKNIATKVVENLTKVVDTGRKIIDKKKPITSYIPGVGQVIDTIDKGLNMADNVCKIGRSLVNNKGEIIYK
ncbi:hypothetical protein M9Y10_040680 [Tritrichomonas musculus]|uniref:Uncharacterized protein n=1 Tax=Tritrichomonas musculus TaxID=1915356 RepID=A0ABR2K291_9EUKA